MPRRRRRTEWSEERILVWKRPGVPVMCELCKVGRHTECVRPCVCGIPKE